MKQSQYVIFFLLLLNPMDPILGQTDKMAHIKGGVFVPLYGRDTLKVEIEDFLMDVYPVTNEQFLQFVLKFSEWQRSKVIPLFADDNYLAEWESDTSISRLLNLNAPVTSVSWFAARKYCECQGKRLPTIDEWEYSAMASQTRPDARIDSSYNQYILNWYETPKTFGNAIGQTFKNYWGVYDLHGLVWEWTIDFNSVLITGESRGDVDLDRKLFCAGGAVGATDLMNYAAFLRFAFRGSLKANYGVKNLGFRCVRDIK